jgi:transposase
MAEYRGDLRRMSNEGLSIAKAAKKLGFVEDTVRRWARIFKITFKKASNRTFKHYNKDGWDDVVRSGAAKGYSYSQIALQLNVPVINVYRHAKKMGLNWKELKKQHAKKN